MEPTKYILYCSQNGNFQTRSMLIPYDKIMNCQEGRNYIETLQKHSAKNIDFRYGDETYNIDNLLIINFTWKGNSGSMDQTDFSYITGCFDGYACGDNSKWFGGEEIYCYYNECDKCWASFIIPNIASSGFNHVANYCNFRNCKEYKKERIEIVDGFLVLESNNGKINKASVETVAEMFQKYYPDKYPEYLKNKYLNP